MMSHIPPSRRVTQAVSNAFKRSRQFHIRAEFLNSSVVGARNPRCGGSFWLGLLASAFLALASACGSGPAHVQARSVIEECEPGEAPPGARCGWVTVFEDRDRAVGRTINLRVVVYPAQSRDPQPDPLFFLAGGPGQGAAQVSSVLAGMFRDVRQDRDLVFIDQRGTGESNGLHCELDTDDLELLFSSDYAYQSIQQCLAEFDADVRHYTTPVAMDDLDEVRAQLGYNKINLWSGSYGTRAALVYLRRHGERVRSAVFDGAAPLAMKLPVSFSEDAQRALDLMLDACEEENPCRNRFPHLRRKLDELLDHLPMQPDLVTAKHPRTGDYIDLAIDQDVVARAVHVALYVPELASMLPLLIERAHGGDFDGLLALALSMESAPSESRISLGMFFSVICAEDLPWIDGRERRQAASGLFAGESTMELWDKVCEIWPRGAIAQDYREPVLSAVPALVLSGALDPVTPPRWGDKLSEGLSNARHIVVPGAAHGTSSQGCVPDLIEQFIRDGSSEGLDDGCVATIDRPPFFVTHAGPPMEAEQ